MHDWNNNRTTKTNDYERAPTAAHFWTSAEVALTSIGEQLASLAERAFSSLHLLVVVAERMRDEAIPDWLIDIVRQTSVRNKIVLH